MNPPPQTDIKSKEFQLELFTAFIYAGAKYKNIPPPRFYESQCQLDNPNMSMLVDDLYVRCTFRRAGMRNITIILGLAIILMSLFFYVAYLITALAQVGILGILLVCPLIVYFAYHIYKYKSCRMIKFQKLYRYAIDNNITPDFLK